MNIYALGIVEKAGKILFLLRKNTKFFSNYYGLVGGKVELHESVVGTLIREIAEEIGISLIKDNVRFAHCLSCKNEKGEEFLALVFNVFDWQGEVVNKEPDKQGEIAWFSCDELPENVIPRHRQIIEMVQRSILYSEDGW
jgi:8-oxo-dGTP diphosphatase